MIRDREPARVRHGAARTRALAAVLAAAAWAGPAVALQPDAPAARETRSTLSGQLELARVVDTAAQRLKVNIEYDASMLKGQVTLRIEGGLSDAELWELMNRVLVSRGLTTIRQPGGGFSVVKLTDAAAVVAPPPLDNAGIDAARPEGPEPGFQSIALRARHRSAKDLVEQITKATGRASGGGAAGALTALGDTGVIVVSDLTPRLAQTTALIALLDTPENRTVLEEIRLRNTSAAALIALMNQVSSKREAVGGQKLAGEALASPDGQAVLVVAPEGAVPAWRSLVDTLDRREPVETAAYSPRNFGARDVANLVEQVVRREGGGWGGGGVAGADDRWRVVVDELTGSLLVTASAAQHQAIRELLARLDEVPEAVRRPMRAFVVKNRAVGEVVGILQEMLNAGVADADVGAAAVVNAPAAPVTVTPMPPPPSSGPGTPVTERPATAAPPRRPSPPAGPGTPEERVSLTVDKGTSTIIAVGESRMLDRIGQLLAMLDVRQPQVMLEVVLVTLSNGQTMDLGVELEKLGVSGDVRTRLSSLFGLGTRGSGGDRDGPSGAAGFTGVVLSPGDFSVVLRALETINQGRALSTPRILVGNNEQATLDSVVQQPFASVNASNTVSTTSFGGTQDAGTVVTIQPQIGEGDHLLLQYSVSLSSFLGPASSPTLPPARQQNRVQSAASIPDGFTVVVGGIEIENRSEAVSQIPLLGSIPIIGEAFKSRSTSVSRSRFYVFIRASVMRHGGFEDLKYVSEQGVADAGVDDDWPDVKPQVSR